MRRVFSTIFSLALAMQMAFAGGIVTNTNQSAAFVRMPAQDATTQIHAVYYNPAGLTKLSDGFHIQIGNQSIIQRKEIESTLSLLNNNVYVGDVSAPLFPTLYAAYKTGDLVFSLGVNPIGGGGSAEYKTGLPSFESTFAYLPELMKSQSIPTDQYSADVYFNGSSIYWGIQAGVSYKINDMISVYGGARYVMVQNSYEGYIRNVQLNPVHDLTAFGGANYTGNLVNANDYFSDLETYSTNASQTFSGLSTALSAAPANDIVSNPTAQALLVGLGLDPTQTTNAVAVAAFNQAAGAANATIPLAQQLKGATEDAEVDSKQTGSGIAPIVGVHLTLMEDKLDIGMKYEHQVTMKVKNETKKDIAAMPQFPDGEEVPSDVPGMLSVGASYKVLPEFRAAAGFHYYFDKPAMYGKQKNGEYVDNEDFIEQNSWELAVGLEYDVSDVITLSGGWVTANTSPALAYQTDLSYALKSNTVAFGARGNITDKFAIDLGIMHTMYIDGEKTGLTSPLMPTITSDEIYRKRTTIFSIAFNYSFGGGSE